MEVIEFEAFMTRGVLRQFRCHITAEGQGLVLSEHDPVSNSVFCPEEYGGLPESCEVFPTENPFDPLMVANLLSKILEHAAEQEQPILPGFFNYAQTEDGRVSLYVHIPRKRVHKPWQARLTGPSRLS